MVHKTTKNRGRCQQLLEVSYRILRPTPSYSRGEQESCMRYFHRFHIFRKQHCMHEVVAVSFWCLSDLFFFWMGSLVLHLFRSHNFCRDAQGKVRTCLTHLSSLSSSPPLVFESAFISSKSKSSQSS